MNVNYYDEINKKLSHNNFESYTTSESLKQKNKDTVELVKEAFIEELKKRNLSYNKEVVDIYPTCIKVEKETLEYPYYREAVDTTRTRIKKDYGIDLGLYSF